MKTSALDKALAALREQKAPLHAKIYAIDLAITALQEQKDAKPKPPAKPRKAKKAAAVEPTT